MALRCSVSYFAFMLAILPAFTHAASFLRHNMHEVLDLLPPASNATTHLWSKAVVDHFDIEGGQSLYWKQRFFVDQSMWCGEGCPIFLMIGGEGTERAPSRHMFMGYLAEKHGAMMVSLEHRFYGESYPTVDMSNENLKFLTSEQALADLARFVQHLTSFKAAEDDTTSIPSLKLNAPTSKSKVVTFGGSYPGNLAAWFALKYPQLIVGTVSSSAPVYAEYDYRQYAEVVGTAMGHEGIGGSAQCVHILADGIKALHALVTSTTPFGMSSNVPDSLRPCAPIMIGSELDLSAYEANVFGNFQGAVQYNMEGRPPFVSDLCKTLTSHDGSSLDALGAASALFVNMSAPFKDRCVGSSFVNDTVKPLSNISFGGQGCSATEEGCSGDRQWIWQSCNEFGFFQTTTANSSANPFYPLSTLNVLNAGGKICEAAYGMTDFSSPNTLWANTNYGNRHYMGDHATLVNGNMDPWHALGIVNETDPFYHTCTGGGICSKQSVQKSSTIVTIEGTAHCRDMYRPNLFGGAPFCPGPACAGNDSQSIVWAHSVIAANVESYLE